MLVTLQSSLPDLFCDTRFTVGQPDHFPYKYGSGSGSHTHLKKFMRLLSVHWSSFPQLKLVESAGNAPASACLQGKCIACLPRPLKIYDLRFWIYDLAGRLGAAPSKLNFGGSVARLVRGLLWKPSIVNPKS